MTVDQEVCRARLLRTLAPGATLYLVPRGGGASFTCRVYQATDSGPLLRDITRSVGVLCPSLRLREDANGWTVSVRGTGFNRALSLVTETLSPALGGLELAYQVL